MNDHLKNYEESIRADERSKIAKQVAAIARDVYKASDLLQEVGDRIMKAAGMPIGNGILKETASKPKADRKMKATRDHCMAVEVVLHGTNSSGGPLTIKEITRGVTFGPKITGAALRQLVVEGKAVEGPRGKFKAVMGGEQCLGGSA